MNILEAFEKSDNIKIWDEINKEWRFLSKKHGAVCLHIQLLRSDQWQPIIEPLTFEKIKAECVTGESLLVDEIACKRLFLGFNRKGNLVTDMAGGRSSIDWLEPRIKNWKISDEKWGGE